VNDRFTAAEPVTSQRNEWEVTPIAPQRADKTDFARRRSLDHPTLHDITYARECSAYLTCNDCEITRSHGPERRWSDVDVVGDGSQYGRDLLGFPALRVLAAMVGVRQAVEKLDQVLDQNRHLIGALAARLSYRWRRL
jgi:hypothetical protein